jgi:hypothetical protein
MDAREFVFPDEPLILSLFNPFPDYVMETVLRRLRDSLCQCPRPVFVLYNTPWDEKVFTKFDVLEKIHERENFQLYQAKPI